MRAVGYTWAIVVEERAVGLVNVANVDEQSKRCEIGVLVCAAVPSRSALAKEALLELGRHLFHYLGLNKVSCLVLPERASLAHWLEKNGFVKEGRLREHTFFNGRFHDEDLWSLTRAGFEVLK